MKDIDKTKKNIHINEIDDGQRKDLFNKFKDAGGQVLTDQDKRKGLIINRVKQKQHQKKLEDHYKNKKLQSNKRIVSEKKITTLISSKTSSPFDRFKIRMRLRILGITGLNTYFFKKSFLQKFNDSYKPSLIELQMIFFSLFKKDSKTGNQIITSLDRISTFYYELVEMASNLYDPYLMDQILDSYKNFPDIPKSLHELKDSFNELFRMLYILKPYENSIYNSFEKSIDMSIVFNEGKKDRSFKKKDLKNSLFIIFNKLYPRLHTLFCYYHGILFSETDKFIETILSINQNEKPGNRSKRDDRTIEVVDIPEQPQEIESEKPSENLNLSNSIKEGLKMMASLDNKTLRSLYDKKGNFEILNDTDKVLLAYLLFLEFENEYSFILTTNKIKYNTDFSTNVKIDYKTKLQDLFNQLNKSQEVFKSYYETYLEYNKIYNQKPLNNNQYIAYSKRLDEITEKKRHVGSQTRTVIKSFMDNVASELIILIEDMNQQQKFISNPQDILDFNIEIEGNKKLNNKKIYEAIEIVFNYISALSYRLSMDGDLSGKLDFENNEQIIDTNKKKSSDNKEDKSSESIFDELDDII